MKLGKYEIGNSSGQSRSQNFWQDCARQGAFVYKFFKCSRQIVLFARCKPEQHSRHFKCVLGAYVSCKCPRGNCSGCNYSRSKCFNCKFSRSNSSRCYCVQGEIIQCAIIQGVIVFNVQMCRVQEEV